MLEEIVLLVSCAFLRFIFLCRALELLVKIRYQLEYLSINRFLYTLEDDKTGWDNRKIIFLNLLMILRNDTLPAFGWP